MNTGKTVFAQLMDYLPMREFQRCVDRYHGNRNVRSFSCRDQLLCLAFAQLTFRESLRDIETCLRSLQSKLYHSGILGKVARSNLADANESRDWRIYGDFARSLIDKARTLYRDESFGLELEETVYAFDATTIDLCLSLFPWAKFRQHKAAVRLHTLLDLRGNIPTFLKITPGNIHEVNALDELFFEAGAFYVLDRGYTDFQRLHTIDEHHAFFIIRAKSNIRCSRVYSQHVNKSTGLRCDQTVSLTGFNARIDYPDHIRRIKFYDTTTQKHFVFLTNNFQLAALTITQLYRCRWQIELFFKWIKQHLSVESFWGRSPNAVKTQICVAISTYLLVLILKKKLRLKRNTYEILQILSVSPFDKTPIVELISRCTLQIPEPQTLEQARLLMF